MKRYGLPSGRCKNVRLESERSFRQARVDDKLTHGFPKVEGRKLVTLP